MPRGIPYRPKERKTQVVIYIDQGLLDQLDERLAEKPGSLVDRAGRPSRSKWINRAIKDKLDRETGQGMEAK